MFKNYKTTLSHILIAIVFLSVGVLIQKKFKIIETRSSVEKRLDNYEFVNPILDCAPDIDAPPKQNKLESDIKSYIEELKTKGNVKDVAVFYKDLNNGPSFGVSSSDLFSSASLLKVPVLIGFLKKAEVYPQILKQKVEYKESKEVRTLSQNILKIEPLLPGTYTVEALLARAILYSDNVAMDLLEQASPDYDVLEVLEDMGVAVQLNGVDALISVKDYASIFRILYNSTFLTPRASQGALELLSQIHLSNGLRAGVPDEVKIAHKFGERRINNIYQFHDCGIVYYTKRPYLLCVMTRGEVDFADLMDAVSEISKIVYKNVSE